MSDDYDSSLKTLDIAKKHRWVIPAVGVHPWSIGACSLEQAKAVSELALNNRDIVRVLGEVGLDKKFKHDTFTYQLEVFKLFIETATEIEAVLNIHAAGAWREVLEFLTRSDVPTAIIHWYTGPKELLKEIIDRGLYITINPAVVIQEKHREIVVEAPLEIILPESDAPYRYRGMYLHPRDVFKVVEHIASIKAIHIEEVLIALSDNYKKLRNKYLRI